MYKIFTRAGFLKNWKPWFLLTTEEIYTSKYPRIKMKNYILMTIVMTKDPRFFEAAFRIHFL